MRERVGTWIVVAVLSVVTLILYVDNARTKNCLANYMVRDSVATVARANAADEERKAFRDVLATIVNPDSTPQARGKSIVDYANLLDRNDKIRAANPVEPPPTQCK